jgi:hypothetical protein
MAEALGPVQVVAAQAFKLVRAGATPARTPSISSIEPAP